MDKYISTDILSGVTYLKCAIMNIINSKEDIEVTDLPYSLIKSCLTEAGYSLTGKIVLFTDFTTIWNKENKKIEVKINLENGEVKFTKS